MTAVSTHRTKKPVRSPRPAFVFALLGSLGVAFASLHTIQPVREAFGFDPVIRPVTRTALAPSHAKTTALPEAARFERLGSVQGIESPAPPVPTRRLGSGTRRAVRLAPVQTSYAETARRPVVTVQPVAAELASSRIIQRPDSARRDAAGLGLVQYAKLDDVLRQFVDGAPAVPVRVIVQTQPGQHATTAQWLTTEGRQVHRLHPSIDGLTVTLSASDVAALSEDPSIARLSIDAVVHATAESTSGTVLKSDVLVAVEYAIANNEQLKIDLVNLSLGHPIFESAETDPLVQMVERAAAAGIIVVASAGGIGLSPETGQLGYVGSSSPGNAPAASNVANDLRLTGTSMAAGVTTGIVALMLDAADDRRDLVDVEPGETSVDLGN